METRSVSRCVAIAAHGKRCQQSPFRGSPYCWHHTQSRKIWAPSRPLGSTSAATRPAAPVEASADPERRAASNAARARTGAAARAADEPGPAPGRGPRPERAEELLEFLESPADGAYVLVRDETGLLGERSISERPGRAPQPVRLAPPGGVLHVVAVDVPGGRVLHHPRDLRR